jgi:hypothetical protein
MGCVISRRSKIIKAKFKTSVKTNTSNPRIFIAMLRNTRDMWGRRTGKRRFVPPVSLEAQPSGLFSTVLMLDVALPTRITVAVQKQHVRDHLHGPDATPSPLGRFRSRESAVGIAINFGLDERGVGVRVPVAATIFLFFTSSRPALWPTQPPIQWVPRAFSPGVKRPGREADHSPPASADHSPPASAEVKKIWIYTFTPPYALMA